MRPEDLKDGLPTKEAWTRSVQEHERDIVWLGLEASKYEGDGIQWFWFLFGVAYMDNALTMRDAVAVAHKVIELQPTIPETDEEMEAALAKFAEWEAAEQQGG